MRNSARPLRVTIVVSTTETFECPETCPVCPVDDQCHVLLLRVVCPVGLGKREPEDNRESITKVSPSRMEQVLTFETVRVLKRLITVY